MTDINEKSMIPENEKKEGKERSAELARLAITALEDKKAEDVRVIDIGDVSVLADYFIIASGNNRVQVQAMADEVDFALTQKGVKPIHIEGKGDGGWMLLDFGSVMVHVFMDSTREYYSLERLWADAEEIPVEF